MSDESDLNSLIKEALENARKDRQKTIEAYENTKEALKTETDEDQRLNVMIADRPIKLLEQLTRSNEQLVRLAQIREKQISRKKEEKIKPVSIQDVLHAAKEENIDIDELNIRVEDDSVKKCGNGRFD